MNSEKFEQEYQELKQQAKKYYDDIAKKELLTIEPKRIFYMLLSLLHYILIIVFITAYLLCWTVFFMDWEEIHRILLLIILTMIVGGLLAGNIYYLISFHNKYKTLLKKKYNILSKLFGLTYYKHGHSQNMIDCVDKCMLFAKYNEIVADDGFDGKYNDVNIEISDAKIHRESANDYSFFYTFSGSIVTFDSNKKINALTLIQPKYHNVSITDRISLTMTWFVWMTGGFSLIGITSLYQGITRQDSNSLSGGIVFCSVALLLILVFILFTKEPKDKTKNKTKLQKIELEDVIFSKDFNVYSYDQIESRYLITTAFIERFLFLQKVFKTKNICCAFVDDKILLLISSKKNLFEIGNLFTSLKNPKCVEKFYDEIIAILLLVNHFKLNEHTRL